MVIYRDNISLAAIDLSSNSIQKVCPLITDNALIKKNLYGHGSILNISYETTESDFPSFDIITLYNQNQINYLSVIAIITDLKKYVELATK